MRDPERDPPQGGCEQKSVRGPQFVNCETKMDPYSMQPFVQTLSAVPQVMAPTSTPLWSLSKMQSFPGPLPMGPTAFRQT